MKTNSEKQNNEDNKKKIENIEKENYSEQIERNSNKINYSNNIHEKKRFLDKNNLYSYSYSYLRE